MYVWYRQQNNIPFRHGFNYILSTVSSSTLHVLVLVLRLYTLYVIGAPEIIQMDKQVMKRLNEVCCTNFAHAIDFAYVVGW